MSELADNTGNSGTPEPNAADVELQALHELLETPEPNPHLDELRDSYRLAFTADNEQQRGDALNHAEAILAAIACRADELQALHKLLDGLSVPFHDDVRDRQLTAAERAQLLVDHFKRQYHTLDRGIASLANAIDKAWALLSADVVSFGKIKKAAAILEVAGKSIKRRES